MAEKKRYCYQWPRPMVTVDAIVLKRSGKKLSVLLIKRGNDPFRGRWALPGGFVDMDEDLPTAVERELQEETGLKNLRLRQWHTFGTPGRDPRGRNITVAYIAVIKRNIRAKAGDDAAQAKWFDIDKLPELAFDHNDVLSMAKEFAAKK